MKGCRFWFKGRIIPPPPLPPLPPSPPKKVGMRDYSGSCNFKLYPAHDKTLRSQAPKALLQVALGELPPSAVKLKHGDESPQGSHAPELRARTAYGCKWGGGGGCSAPAYDLQEALPKGPLRKDRRGSNPTISKPDHVSCYVYVLCFLFLFCCGGGGGGGCSTEHQKLKTLPQCHSGHSPPGAWSIPHPEASSARNEAT